MIHNKRLLGEFPVNRHLNNKREVQVKVNITVISMRSLETRVSIYLSFIEVTD